MFKAGLLLLLGIAVGLWLGFNPQAHQKMLENWGEAKSAYLRIQTQAKAKFNGLALQLSSSKQSASSSAPKWVNTAWRQLASIFNTIWISVRRLWLSISSNINMHSLGLKK